MAEVRHVKDGGTMNIKNDTNEVIKAHTAMVVGAKLVVVQGDIAPGLEGVAMTDEVFTFPSTGAIPQGSNVTFAAGSVKVAGEDDPIHGYANEAAENDVCNVKLLG